MANVTQLYSILNAVAPVALGTEALTVVDTQSFVALGDSVLSSSNNVDKFVGALVDRIGRTVVSTRLWNAPESDPLVKKPFEYGAILQKIYVDIEDAAANNAWEIGDSGYTPVFAPVTKPSVSQKLFDKISTWEFDSTIPDNILRTAFINETEMAAFITSVFTAIDNSMMLALRNANNLVRATGMAYTLNRGGNNAINLLSEYNTAFPTKATTAAACLYDPDFLRYAATRIKDTMRYLKDLSRAWNNESFARHTPDDVKVVTLLQRFDSAETMYLQSDTFHNELVDMGANYNTVSFWQGAGESYAFDDISGIKITINDEGDKDIEQTGILAVIHDSEAMGSTIDKRRTTTQRNDKDEYTSYYKKANIGYFYDGSENIVVFYVQDGE